MLSQFRFLDLILFQDFDKCDHDLVSNAQLILHSSVLLLKLPICSFLSTDGLLEFLVLLGYLGLDKISITPLCTQSQGWSLLTLGSNQSSLLCQLFLIDGLQLDLSF